MQQSTRRSEVSFRRLWPNLLRVLSRIRYAWARQRIDDESRRELDTHLDLLVDRYTRLGMTPEEAQVAARRQFGNVTRAREEIYQINGIGWVDWLSQDLRYALRQLLRSPGFTLTTVLTLAIGNGSGLIRMPLTTLKIAVVAPMPMFCRPRRRLALITNAAHARAVPTF